MRAGIAATQALCVVLAAGGFGLRAQAIKASFSFARVTAVRSLTNGVELRDGPLLFRQLQQRCECRGNDRRRHLHLDPLEQKIGDPWWSRPQLAE